MSVKQQEQQQQQQQQQKTATMIEPLEGRRLCSASPGFEAEAAAAVSGGGGGAGKVSMQDIHFVARPTKSSPGLRIRMEDVLVSSYNSAAADGNTQPVSDGEAGKVSMQDISFTAKVSKASPKLFL